jgi:hypothetical protein
MRQSPAATEALFALMRAQHGVASCEQARDVGVSRAVEGRLLREGALRLVLPGVLVAGGMPVTRLAMLHAATLRPGVVAISHGAAARVHGFSAFDRYEPVDIIGGRGARLQFVPPLLTHYSRGPLDAHVTIVDGVRVISPALTLVHVAPQLGLQRTAVAIGEAIGRGVSAAKIRNVARAWRSTGRAGPSIVLAALEQASRSADFSPPLCGRAATVPRRDSGGAA